MADERTITKRELITRLSDPRCPADAPVLVRVVQRGRHDGPHGAFYAEEHPIDGAFTGWQDGHWSILAVAPIAPVDFARLRAANATRVQRWHGPTSEPWTGADWSNAMQGEAGEAGNVVKKLRRAETGAVNDGDPSRDELIAALADEIADIVIYLDILAAHYDIDIPEAVRSKFNRTSERYGFPERLA